MIMVILLILDLGGVFDTIAEVVVWISLILTVISLIDYLYKNWSVMDGQM